MDSRMRQKVPLWRPKNFIRLSSQRSYWNINLRFYLLRDEGKTLWIQEWLRSHLLDPGTTGTTIQVPIPLICCSSVSPEPNRKEEGKNSLWCFNNWFNACQSWWHHAGFHPREKWKMSLKTISDAWNDIWEVQMYDETCSKLLGAKRDLWTHHVRYVQLFHDTCPVWTSSPLPWKEHQIIAPSRYNKHHTTLTIILLKQQRFMGLSGLLARCRTTWPRTWGEEHAEMTRPQRVCAPKSVQTFYLTRQSFKGY